MHIKCIHVYAHVYIWERTIEHPKLILLSEIYVWIQLQLVTLQFGSIAWRLKKVGIREFVSSSFCDGYVIFFYPDLSVNCICEYINTTNKDFFSIK